ncbi:MAG TPA: hypothetical protein VFV38_05485 [Ktedonobacteraceae bacterium]|nr:hypothetical protein [Ktedonobacteraceae bacterium]
MKNPMDRPDQPPEGDQPPAPESQLSSLSAPRQKQTTLVEQRLLNRIMWLMLLLGIMLGIFLTLFAGLSYVLDGSIPHAFSPNSPIIYRSLGPLMFTAFGCILILLGIVQRLRGQHPAFRAARFDLINGYSWPFTSLGFGFLFIWLGSANVILLWFGPDPDVWSTVEIAGTVVLLLIAIAELFVPFIRNRRSGQHHATRQKPLKEHESFT